MNRKKQKKKVNKRIMEGAKIAQKDGEGRGGGERNTNVEIKGGKRERTKEDWKENWKRGRYDGIFKERNVERKRTKEQKPSKVEELTGNTKYRKGLKRRNQ